MNSRKLYFALTALTILCVLSGSGQAVAADGIQSKSVIVLEMSSGRVLYQENADARIAPASLTKIMTLYTGMQMIRSKDISLGTSVTVSRLASQPGGSCMGLKSGERVSLDKLIYGMAVASGNDASQAFAEFLSGSHFAFVTEMNRQAKLLGMTHSTFKNAHGMPADGQFTTARDMAVLSGAYLREFPEMLHYHSTRAILHNGRSSTNKNPFITAVNGVDGLKSGWVTASGYNLITTAQRNGSRIIVVVMGAATAEQRAQDTLRLVEASFMALTANTTVKSQLALLRPADFTVNIAQARQNALADLSRPAQVRGSIGTARPGPAPAATAVATATGTAAGQRQTQSTGNSIVVGSIGSPTPTQTASRGNVAMAAR